MTFLSKAGPDLVIEYEAHKYMNKNHRNSIAIIPVRGGSKGISRKNARLLNGKPLLAYIIQSAQQTHCFSKIFVSTDDEELAFISQKYGATVIHRPEYLAKDEVGLDEVILDAVHEIEKNHIISFSYVATLQATCPLLKPNSIHLALFKIKHKKLDTVLSVVDDTHLRWSENKMKKLRPDFKKRLNRQFQPKAYRETGGIVICSKKQINRGSRFGKKVDAIILDKKESVDIDDRTDWWLVEQQLKRKKIVLRVEGHEDIGLGHIYRCLTLADNMLEHDIIFVISNKSKLGIEVIKSRFYPLLTFSPVGQNELNAIKSCNPDIVINDILNTQSSYITSLKKEGYKVINFEDQGSGSKKADKVINAMYDNAKNRKNIYVGTKYVCLRDEFYLTKPISIKKKVRNILVLFGGTDPSRLTVKTLKWLLKLSLNTKITVITGPGYKQNTALKQMVQKSKNKNVEIMTDTKIITKYMENADIAITSAGRTVFELACLCIPMIILCQNQRETTHKFASNAHGIINLGLGKSVKSRVFHNVILEVVNTYKLRKKMHTALKKYNLKEGIKNVWKLILN